MDVNNQQGSPDRTSSLANTMRMFKATENYVVEESEFHHSDADPESHHMLPTRTTQVRKTHIIRPSLRRCTCGAWQDLGYPCRHGFAYYTKWEHLPLHEILNRHVSKFYTFGNLQKLYNQSFIPVVSDNIPHDRITNPPPIGQRQPGRPRVKRLRRRHESSDPEVSRITCSRCKNRGHNARTCSQP